MNSLTGKIMEDKEKAYKVRIPLFPLYSHTREFLKVINGELKKDVTHLIQTISSLTGAPQHPVDWTDPPSIMSFPEQIKSLMGKMGIWNG